MFEDRYVVKTQYFVNDQKYPVECGKEIDRIFCRVQMELFKQQLKNIAEHKLSLLISGMFILFYFHYAFNETFKSLNISIVLGLIFSFFLYKKQVIRPSMFLVVFCVIGFLTITLNYHLLSRMELIPQHLYRTYKQLINQYIWFIPLMALPTIYFNSSFKVRYFYQVIFFTLLFLFFYLGYYGIQLEFDRGRFSYFFNPVISYDIGFISLTLILLCYSFLIKGKVSYCYLVLSLLTLFLLILHGSRGTWIGIPFAFLVLGVFYFKTQAKKLMLAFGLSACFIIINLVIPNSPILSRMQNLQADTQHIQNNNYQNSSGIRLYLWKNSIELFQQAPVIGVGMHEIELDNCRLHDQGDLPTCFQHMHSIYFHELAANGLLGFLGLLLTFCTAIMFFLKNIFNRDDKIKNLALTGLIFVIYYMLCGLTEYYLFFKNTTYLFYWVVASLMSFIMIQQLKLKQNNRR